MNVELFYRGTSGDTARPPCGDPPTPEMMTCTKCPCLSTHGGMIPAASNYWPRERRRFLRPNLFLRPTISQRTHTTSPSASPSPGPHRILHVCPHPEDKEGWSMRIVSSFTMSPIVSPAQPSQPYLYHPVLQLRAANQDTIIPHPL